MRMCRSQGSKSESPSAAERWMDGPAYLLDDHERVVHDRPLLRRAPLPHLSLHAGGLDFLLAKRLNVGDDRFHQLHVAKPAEIQACRRAIACTLP